jgi:trans-aconitate 2-methyltransferase
MDCTLKPMADWDAARYHRVSDPQHGWGLRVLERLAPSAGERILDIGCGTGRLTSDLTRRARGLFVVGLDRSATMLSEAARHVGDRAQFVQADAAALPLVEHFDAVFSTATFHWVPDHERLFAEIYRVLRPGGRLVSQAGGGANLARLRARSEAVQQTAAFVPYFTGWKEPWRYAGVDATRSLLAAAGFVDIEVGLEPAPTRFADPERYREFVACVCLRRQLDLIPSDKHESYLRPLLDQAAADDPPFTLDYWRLNIDAGRR